ncbi:hypothetical protein [Hyphococcus luteus]|uniref:Uncharacterized protein n=1 Tax=Hyphococcus luteus TaxID=2058213 RepID=A0A2S7K5V9_9PROT|nr:hypothetical protein [Marinicaulis flavus]PQA87861.1 hypothetical protein CW354_05780 [Marinicaulis flavus]
MTHMTKPATFYLRQINQIALGFSVATGLIMTAGILAMLVLFPPSAHQTRSADSDAVIMQAAHSGPAAPAD